VMYAYIREYNPAYDIFLVNYFREGGIAFDENLTFQEVEPRWIFALDAMGLSPRERLFCSYLSDWRLHPEARPSFYHLLNKTLDVASGREVENLRELESSLKPGQGKLLFSKEEVALDISEFYRKHYKRPLETDVDSGVTGRELSRYFSIEEIKRLPYVRDVGKDKMEEAQHKRAGELLAWLDKATTEKIILDIEHLLEEHSRSIIHMKIRKPTPTDKEFFECWHRSEYVQLSGYRDIGDERTSTSLQPARGFNIPNLAIEEGWNEVVFPWYHVKEAPPAIITPEA